MVTELKIITRLKIDHCMTTGCAAGGGVTYKGHLRKLRKGTTNLMRQNTKRLLSSSSDTVVNITFGKYPEKVIVN